MKIVSENQFSGKTYFYTIAIQELKMAIRASGEHKQRVVIHIAVDGLKIRDEKTGVSRNHFQMLKLRLVNKEFPAKWDPNLDSSGRRGYVRSIWQKLRIQSSTIKLTEKTIHFLIIHAVMPVMHLNSVPLSLCQGLPTLWQPSNHAGNPP